MIMDHVWAWLSCPNTVSPSQHAYRGRKSRDYTVADSHFTRQLGVEIPRPLYNKHLPTNLLLYFDLGTLILICDWLMCLIRLGFRIRYFFLSKFSLTRLKGDTGVK